LEDLAESVQAAVDKVLIVSPASGESCACQTKQSL
jgi:hypothetical protein